MPSPQKASAENAPHGPPRSQAAPAMGGPIRAPSRTAALMRPVCTALPLMAWPITACAPIQPDAVQ